MADVILIVRFSFFMEGWRSGQSQQTVNLPGYALRWFKSSSLHQPSLDFFFLSTMSDLYVLRLARQLCVLMVGR